MKSLYESEECQSGRHDLISQNLNKFQRGEAGKTTNRISAVAQSPPQQYHGGKPKPEDMDSYVQCTFDPL